MRIVTNEPRSVGLISDTHNLLRPSVERLFRNCNVIIHAGDIGDVEILQKLENIAPVVAVRGNTDSNLDYDKLSEVKIIDLFGVSFCIIHDLDKLSLSPATSGVKVIVSGHTHKPKIFEDDSVLYINPGSAGYRRSGCPIALAMMSIENNNVNARIIQLDGPCV